MLRNGLFGVCVCAPKFLVEQAAALLCYCAKHHAVLIVFNILHIV